MKVELARINKIFLQEKDIDDLGDHQPEIKKTNVIVRVEGVEGEIIEEKVYPIISINTGDIYICEIHFYIDNKLQTNSNVGYAIIGEQFSGMKCIKSWYFRDKNKNILNEMRKIVHQLYLNKVLS